ncbi:MAG: FAD-dependent oxidoreductase [Pseudomonadota bacterium]
MTIAIIGAGMAGLSAAHALREAGKAVHLFDKGRGPGGRMSTRRAETPLGEMRWDHGAQFFTVRDPGFAKLIDELEAAGAVAKWSGPYSDQSIEPRYVGTPGMNAVIRSLADGFDVSWGHRVTVIAGSAGTYQLRFETGEVVGPYEAVISAVPAEQVSPLLASVAPQLAAEAETIHSAPSWTVMLAFAQVIEATNGKPAGSSSIGWMAKNASKPGRGAGETWLIQATAEWSKAHLEDEKEDVAAEVTREFLRLIEAPNLQPAYAAAHRWRYAFVENPTGNVASWDPDLQFGTCGDWQVGPRVECAWLSGQAMAAKVLG